MSMMLSFVGDDLGFSTIGWEHHPLVGISTHACGGFSLQWWTSINVLGTSPAINGDIYQWWVNPGKSRILRTKPPFDDPNRKRHRSKTRG